MIKKKLLLSLLVLCVSQSLFAPNFGVSKLDRGYSGPIRLKDVVEAFLPPTGKKDRADDRRPGRTHGADAADGRPGRATGVDDAASGPARVRPEDLGGFGSYDEFEGALLGGSLAQQHQARRLLAASPALRAEFSARAAQPPARTARGGGADGEARPARDGDADATAGVDVGVGGTGRTRSGVDGLGGDVLPMSSSSPIPSPAASGRGRGRGAQLETAAAGVFPGESPLQALRNLMGTDPREAQRLLELNAELLLRNAEHIGVESTASDRTSRDGGGRGAPAAGGVVVEDLG